MTNPTNLPNPLIPGFNPDPSITLVDGVYYLVTSTFEYLPGLPIYRSTDLVTWEHIGSVATRESQIGVADVQTAGGVWAPTIRHHDGVFHVIVTIALTDRGCVLFTADDPAGPWSDGVTLEGVGGIDPDIAWADDGTVYVTFSGMGLTGADAGKHYGIQQVRMELATGRALEAPRSLWSGTGLQFPEAPHLYQRGDEWYLLVAEGGTERGHGVSIARGPSPEGPFTPAAGNPILSARSTSRPIQNTGHGDLVETPDGGTALILLGVRPLGGTRAFSPLGRETFITDVEWVDEWPVVAPVQLNPRVGADVEQFDFSNPDALDDPGWIAVRRVPAEIASLTVTPGRLTIEAGAGGLDSAQPSFVGRRQRHIESSATATIDASAGAGGLATRYDEQQFYGLEARGTASGTTVTAIAVIADLRQTWQIDLPAGEVRLRIETRRPPVGFSAEAMGGDRIRLVAGLVGSDDETVLSELDGRYWTAETCASFTGRVTGLFATAGTVTFGRYDTRGDDS